MDDHTEPLEFVEVPVNGRHVDVGGDGLYLSGDLLGSPVPGTFEQAAQQQTTRSGDPAAVSPEQVHHLFDGAEAGSSLPRPTVASRQDSRFDAYSNLLRPARIVVRMRLLERGGANGRDPSDDLRPSRTRSALANGHGWVEWQRPSCRALCRRLHHARRRDPAPLPPLDKRGVRLRNGDPRAHPWNAPRI